MIFGSKALSVAVLGALVLSDEAAAATVKKGKHNNKTLRKADRKLDSLVQPDATPVCSGPVDVSIRMSFSFFNSLRSQFTYLTSNEA